VSLPRGSHVAEGAGSFTNLPYIKPILDCQLVDWEILGQALKVRFWLVYGKDCVQRRLQRKRKVGSAMSITGAGRWLCTQKRKLWLLSRVPTSQNDPPSPSSPSLKSKWSSILLGQQCQARLRKVTILFSTLSAIPWLWDSVFMPNPQRMRAHDRTLLRLLAGAI